MTGAASTSASTAAGDRATSAGNSPARPPWELSARPLAKAAITQPAVRPVVRSAIAGRPPHGCSGIEGQGNWAAFRGSHTSLFFPTIQNQSRVDAFGLLTGQVGYAWNNVLLYGKGGAAGTGDRYRTFNIPTGLLLDTANDTRWGGTVGVGIEVGFAPNWSVAFEYDHLFMSRRNITFTTVGTLGTPGIFSASDRIGQDVDLATVRVNYRWGGPVIGGPGYGGPGVARY